MHIGPYGSSSRPASHPTPPSHPAQSSKPASHPNYSVSANASSHTYNLGVAKLTVSHSVQASTSGGVGSVKYSADSKAVTISNGHQSADSHGGASVTLGSVSLGISGGAISASITSHNNTTTYSVKPNKDVAAAAATAVGIVKAGQAILSSPVARTVEEGLAGLAEALA